MQSCNDVRSWNGESNKENFDSLFLGMYLGMDKKLFHDHCWELNRQKVFTHGPSNTSVEYKLVNELPETVMMRFYPTFYNEKIFEMPVTFSYEAWAPWNKQYSSQELLNKMLGVFKKWYGEDFKKIDHPRMGTIFVKMDGKRRINLFVRDDQFVQAVFTDLKMEREMKSAREKNLNDSTAQKENVE
jgi:hypothetical protein